MVYQVRLPEWPARPGLPVCCCRIGVAPENTGPGSLSESRVGDYNITLFPLTFSPSTLPSNAAVIYRFKIDSNPYLN